MAKDRQDIVGVSAVVRDGAGRILLIKTAKAGWELPGGRVERGEDFITALKPRHNRQRVSRWYQHRDLVTGQLDS